nr:uncharacterized protein LOC105713753 isoform X2 [Aotus nancymaae]
MAWRGRDEGTESRAERQRRGEEGDGWRRWRGPRLREGGGEKEPSGAGGQLRRRERRAAGRKDRRTAGGRRESAGASRARRERDWTQLWALRFKCAILSTQTPNVKSLQVDRVVHFSVLAGRADYEWRATSHGMADEDVGEEDTNNGIADWGDGITSQRKENEEMIQRKRIKSLSLHYSSSAHTSLLFEQRKH